MFLSLFDRTLHVCSFHVKIFFMEEFTHYTVMKNEAVDALQCENGKIYVDCTLGGGGHSGLILSRIQQIGRASCRERV